MNVLRQKYKQAIPLCNHDNYMLEYKVTLMFGIEATIQD